MYVSVALLTTCYLLPATLMPSHFLFQIPRLTPGSGSTMKSIITLFLVIFCSSCRAQVYAELGGLWLPEEYIKGLMAKKTNQVNEGLFPIQALEISEHESRRFVREYLPNRDSINVDDLILILLHESEWRGFKIQKVKHAGIVKYKIDNLYQGFNLMSIPPNILNTYRESEVYMSKLDDKLLIEVINKNETIKIYFIDRLSSHVFTSVEEAVEYVNKNNH